MLKDLVPMSVMSSNHPKFLTMTGQNTDSLRRAWRARSPLTTCNAFAGYVAREIGATDGVLSAGRLNLSAARGWVWANTGEAIQKNLYPLPGDFFCTSIQGQPFAHVGILVEIDPETLAWKWIAGGQGGTGSVNVPKEHKDDRNWIIDQAFDYIKWGPWHPTSSRTFSEARPAVMGWVDIGYHFFPTGPD
jgi:hypothetical protein